MSQRSLFKIDAACIVSWDSFHDVFARECDFPGHYGRNLDAWIDCMGDLADPGSVACLHLENADALRAASPEIWEALLECVAFVNFCSVDAGGPAVLALSYDISAT